LKAGAVDGVFALLVRGRGIPRQREAWCRVVEGFDEDTRTKTFRSAPLCVFGHSGMTCREAIFPDDRKYLLTGATSLRMV